MEHVMGQKKGRLIRMKSVEECEFEDIRTTEALNRCGLWVCDEEIVERRKRRLRHHLVRKLSSPSSDLNPSELSPEMRDFCIEISCRHGIPLNWEIQHTPNVMAVKKTKRKGLFKSLLIGRFRRNR
ncbi:unnamed protein product [Bursaphelenchus xylophilus]|uniref:(pine wood nematode) hypothetical protein n=1 Tax=Bursaphelenchus xylophilus TaxID=6326 RepID=A0A1I7RKH0_BURXY|nr:unnamed protein product [Bursaphelenchus xylophilus]CAG9131330.1 unnamed protein product [Bursaphelenchus xylophilus]